MIAVSLMSRNETGSHAPRIAVMIFNHLSNLLIINGFVDLREFGWLFFMFETQIGRAAMQTTAFLHKNHY